MCNMNKNHLLTLFFHEGSRRQEKEIQTHVNQCKECQDYLLILQQTHQSLQQWNDESPPSNTLDSILANIPEVPEIQKKPAAAKPGLSITPVFMIPFAIGLILAIIFFLRDKITLLPFLETLKTSWLGQILGSFGVTAMLFFLLGICVTLALTPVLIMESRSNKHRYKYSFI
ncbi:MAG: hypothetical protein GTO45_06715 [Candidatus Aminicenantes bacterium]|nr:hypothetical protein [Candidatus Aminicenantes bacterium]NIM78534.1 hypothetical protein [Candidatus Aminicenantes bacterium]NIN17779.1 hypothetical protein [Candidatus Aminicenantes bacterium]NIN41681.1 hypothetical protein [Candidatus Aminicenantes bacterium]NIN84430.1 hypothetical protein [Candidatus Aminicenantes bacterium]